MIHKISIGFLGDDSNAELVVKVDTITSALTGNPDYPAADSGIAEVIALNTQFKEAIVAAADGGTSLTAARNAKRQELAMRMRTLAAYVQANGKNDLTILLSSGFPMQKSTRTPSTVLPAPLLQSIGAGPNSGTVVMKLVALGAQVYNWRCFLTSAPQTILDVTQSTAATTLFAGNARAIVLFPRQCDEPRRDERLECAGALDCDLKGGLAKRARCSSNG